MTRVLITHVTKTIDVCILAINRGILKLHFWEQDGRLCLIFVDKIMQDRHFSLNRQHDKNFCVNLAVVTSQILTRMNCKMKAIFKYFWRRHHPGCNGATIPLSESVIYDLCQCCAYHDNICMCVCMYVYCVGEGLSESDGIYVRVCLCVCIYMYMYIYVCVYIYIYIYIYM